LPIVEDMIEQGRFAGTEKARENRNRKFRRHSGLALFYAQQLHVCKYGTTNRLVKHPLHAEPE
jgi:hypothetical protein